MNAAAGLRSRPLAWIYFLVGVATTGLYFALPWDSFAQALVYDGIGASAAVAVLLGTWIHHPSLRLPWYLFGAGLFAFTAGDVSPGTRFSLQGSSCSCSGSAPRSVGRVASMPHC
jgi:hypothetical protein